MDKRIRSGRVRGAVGTGPTKVTKFILDEVRFKERWGHKRYVETHRVLDFGCGKYNTQAKILFKEDIGVDCYDVPENAPGFEWEPIGGTYRYDTIMLSNVINVQDNLSKLDATLRKAVSFLAPGGVIVANYPSTPRYLGLNKRDMRRVLSARFNIRDTHDGLWLLTVKGGK